MARMEIITRAERRRIYNDDEMAVVVAASFEVGVIVRKVAQRFGIAASLVYNWPSPHRKAVSLVEPVRLISHMEAAEAHPHWVIGNATLSESAEPTALASQLAVPNAYVGFQSARSRHLLFNSLICMAV